MIRISVDDQRTDFLPEDSQNLGEFIEAVSSSLPPNRIVTNIALDGRGLSRKDATHLYEKTLDSVSEVQIKTAERTLWAAAGVDMSLSCLEGLQKSLLCAAELFREADRIRANRLFVHCMEGLERFLETLAITRHAMNLDFKNYKVDGVSLTSMESQLSTCLVQLVQHQENTAYDDLADNIEDTLLTNLCAWSTALRQIRNSQLSHA